MGWRLSTSLVLMVAGASAPAFAQARAPMPGPPTARFAIVPSTPLPALVPSVTRVPFRPAAIAVLAFPDVVPERRKPAPDPTLDLLSTNPYESALLAHKIAINLYGEDPPHEDPYADDLHLANPYTNDPRLVGQRR